MNGRRSRLRRRERQLAAREARTPETSTAAEQLLALRQARDVRLIDSNRRRRNDLENLEAYYQEEREAIWLQFRHLEHAIRTGQRLVFPEPQVVEAQLERLTFLGRLRRLFSRAPLPEAS
ncbi:MAG TPA: hypothetical protein VM204_03465 [Gaiellaceae bacterium]|nr:hypothetical protein [Gaiellaceae bacterium]